MKKLAWEILWHTAGVAITVGVSMALVGCSSDDGTLIPVGPTVTRTFAPTRTPTSVTSPTRTATSPATQATATPTSPSGQPTATPTGQSGGQLTGAEAVEAFAGNIAGVVQGFAGFASQSTSGSGAIVGQPLTVDCTNGGTISTTTTIGTVCQFNIELDNCHTIENGLDSTTNGTVVVDLPAGCLAPTGSPIGVQFTGSVEQTNLETTSTLSGTFDVTASVTLGSDGSTTVTESGTGNVSCVGEFSFTTTVPIFIPAGTNCATAGQLRATLADGTSTVTFVEGGLALDIGEDGVVDQNYPTCTDAELAQCG